MSASDICLDCYGTGDVAVTTIDSVKEPCPTCRGSGHVVVTPLVLVLMDLPIRYEVHAS